MNLRILSIAVALSAVLLACAGSAQSVAPTPPMGWNSWDAYGFTIDEAQVKANATVLASVQQFGWKYVIIDEGWYMANPAGKNLAERKYLLDANGRLVPDPARYPDAANGAGFKPLADWLHRLGLRFGIHIVSGIPRDAVTANLPILGTNFHAAEAADTTAACPWDDGNYGVADNAAGQAYYNSILKLYAAWGVDFLKADCIATNPYRPTEIRQIAQALRNASRPMVLSLSPGPAAPENAAEVQESAQMWRVTEDHWDAWSYEHKPGENQFPAGIRPAFDALAKWFAYAGPGSWPDADMLPEGWLGPNPGWGKPRQSQLTPDEQRTEFALWAIARSPLILGGNLTRLDDLTRSLMNNQDLLFMNQNVTYSRPVDSATLGAGFESARVWRATIGQPGARGYAEYFGFFNLNDAPVTLKTTWKQLGLDNNKHSAQSAWDGSVAKEAKDISVTLPAHGSAVYQVR